MNDVDLAFSPVHYLARQIADGDIDPVDLLELYLDRIARYDDVLHAYVTVFSDAARRAAEACAIAIREGRPIGRLHGVPIAVKDLCDVAGYSSGAGSLRRAGIVAAKNSAVVRRLLAAGAIVLGKTHMTEFAFGSWGTNAVTGTPRNPWDSNSFRVPGGSSSGSGVAVAAGLAPAAIGSDTGGSVRIPASVCGIVGLKTTFGRISTDGVVPLSSSLDTIGPMTRCVEDAALLFDVLKDDNGSQLQSSCGLDEGVAGLRIAAPPKRQLSSVNAAVYDAIAAACAALRRLGAHIEEVEFPEAYFGSASDMQNIISAEGYAATAELIDPEGAPLDPDVHARLLSGKNVTAAAYIRSLERQRDHRARFLAFLQDYAAALMPTTPVASVTLDQLEEQASTMSQLTRPVNYLGLCALAVPCGFNDSGLPLSFQVIGRPNEEPLLLRIGYAYEQSSPEQRRPNLDTFMTAAVR